MTTRTLIKALAAVAVAAFSTTASAVVYLDASATGAGNGTSWADAYTDAATAINAAAGQELRVAQGVYVMSASIAMPNGITVKGGYAGGTSASPDARDIDAYQSIFTGDQSGLTTRWKHVEPYLDQAKTPKTTTMTATVIANGKINIPAYTGDYDGYVPYKEGTHTPQFMTVAAGVGGTLDGIYVSGFGFATSGTSGMLMNIASGAGAVTVTNCRFVGNYIGYLGGVYISGNPAADCSFVFSGCQFRFNGAPDSASNARGLAFHFSGSVTIQNCLFESICRANCNNSGSVLMGNGGNSSYPTIQGCMFTRCLHSSSWNINYGGPGNIYAGGGSSPNVKFLDCVVSNCYTACTGPGFGIPLFNVGTGNNSRGMIIDGVQFVNNLSIVSTAAGRCPVMVGTAASSTKVGGVSTPDATLGYFTLARCLFKGNSIYAASSAASASDRVALGLVGNDSPAAMALVNCVFDDNTATAAEGPTTVCSRGVVCNSHSTMYNTSAGLGLANCTFTGPADGVYDVVQFGDGHNKALNIVNSVFEAEGAMAASPFSFDMPAQVGLYSSSVKGMLSAPANVTAANFASDPVPLAGDYAPAARVPGIRATADVQTNALATANAPVTFSFKPYGATAYQALSPAQSTGSSKKGFVCDYAASAAARPEGSFTRGAVQALTAAAEAGCTVTVRLSPVELADASVYGDSAAYHALVPAGDPASVEAHPAAGKYFARWESESGSLYSEDNPLTIPALSSDLVLTAVFSETSQHRHSWTYAADGATLTATCSNAGCEDTPCVVSVVCAGKECDGTPVAAVVTNAETLASLTGATVGAIVYKQGDAVLDAAPSAVGSYTASATVTVGGNDYVLVASFDIIPHVHSWSYAQNGSVLTATCAGACADSPVFVSLSCTAENVYDEEPVTATLEGGDAFAAATGATVGAIVYKQGDVVLGAAPSAVGEYTANVTVSAGDDDYVLTVGFVITAHEHSWTYALNGAVLTATCTAGDCRLGTISVSLVGDSTKFNDVAPGPYALTVDGLDAFTAATGATIGDPRFVLTASATALPSAPSDAGAYYVELSVTAGGEAYTLRKDFYIEEAQTGVCLKAGATGAGTGIDWENAYTDFPTALAAAVAKGVPLRVAQGVYVVTEAIALPDGFSIEGGYAGVQGSYDRDIDEFQTIICGDQAQNNVWWRFTPDESKAAITTAATTEPVIKDGKFNDPVAALSYSGDYDGFFTKPNGTDTVRCFTISGDVGGTLDGLYIIGFGEENKSVPLNGVAIAWQGGPSAERIVVLKDLRIYGCTLSNSAIGQATFPKLTTQMSGCRIAYSGADFTGYNCRYLIGRFGSKGYVRDCTFESLLRNKCGGNSVTFLILEQSDSGKPGVDVENCMFARCATCAGANSNYGGNMGVVGYGNSTRCMSRFCNNTIRNCYIGATGTGDFPLFGLAQGSGWTGSNVHNGLRIENNLQLLNMADGASYVMVGVGGNVGTRTAPFSIESSVFRNNRIKVLSGAANSAVGLVGGSTTGGGQFNLVNCVFDGNTVESAVEGVTLSRGVICADDGTGRGAFGIANCTFRSSGAGYDVVQWGAQGSDANVVNCSFDATDAQTYNPFCAAGGATSTIRLFSSTVKNCLDVNTLGVSDCDSAFAFDAIPLNADYRPLVRMPKIRTTAAVFTNEVANGTTGSGGAGRQYPNTYSFQPVGSSARQALCAGICNPSSTGTADKGVIDDLYGESRTAGNTRGAVQRMDDLAESDEYAAVVIRPRDMTVEGGVTTAGLSTAAVSIEAMMVPKNGEATVQAFRDTTTKRVFAGWYNEDGSQYSPLNPLTFSGLEDDLTLEARFMVRNGAAIFFF